MDRKEIDHVTVAMNVINVINHHPDVGRRMLMEGFGVVQQLVMAAMANPKNRDLGGQILGVIANKETVRRNPEVDPIQNLLRSLSTLALADSKNSYDFLFERGFVFITLILDAMISANEGHRGLGMSLLENIAANGDEFAKPGADAALEKFREIFGRSAI